MNSTGDLNLDAKMTNGAALAAYLAAGVGAFATGLIVLLNEMGVFAAPAGSSSVAPDRARDCREW